MNRRQVLKTLVAVLPTSALAIPDQRYGPVMIKRHNAFIARGIYLHVYHHGEDVTSRCCFADDTGDGIAELFLLNAEGKWHLRDRKVAKEIVHGVTIKAGKKFR